MKKYIVIAMVIMTTSLVGCSVFPLKATIQENHVRFENFKRDKGDEIEHIYLLCHHQKPSTWFVPKQFLAGQHELWVRAIVTKRGVKNSAKDSYVKFNVALEPNKSYMLNRVLKEKQISIWIQEVETGVKVTPVQFADLSRPLLLEEMKMREMCKSSTV